MEHCQVQQSIKLRSLENLNLGLENIFKVEINSAHSLCKEIQTIMISYNARLLYIFFFIFFISKQDEKRYWTYLCKPVSHFFFCIDKSLLSLNCLSLAWHFSRCQYMQIQTLYLHSKNKLFVNIMNIKENKSQTEEVHIQLKDSDSDFFSLEMNNGSHGVVSEKSSIFLRR